MEYKEKLKELNITEDLDNEVVIGTVTDIQNLFLFMIKQDIDNMDLELKEVLRNIDIKTELIKELYSSRIYYFEKVKVWLDPMGKYNFALYEEV